MMRRKTRAGPGAVHLGGLVEVARDRLQAGEQDQRVEAHVRPDRDADGGGEGRAALGQPVDRLAAEAVDDQLRRPWRCRIQRQIRPTTTGESSTGKKKTARQKLRAREVAVEDQRGDHRDRGHQRDLEDDEAGGVPDRGPELVVAAGVRVEVVPAVEQARVVLGADEGAVGEEERVAAGHRVEEVGDQREEHEDAEDRHVRQRGRRRSCRAAPAARWSARSGAVEQAPRATRPAPRWRRRASCRGRRTYWPAWATWSAMSWSMRVEGLVERQLARHHLAGAGDERGVVGVGPFPRRQQRRRPGRRAGDGGDELLERRLDVRVVAVELQAAGLAMTPCVRGQEQRALGELLHHRLAAEVLDDLRHLLGVLGVLDRHQRRRRPAGRSRPRCRRASRSPPSRRRRRSWWRGSRPASCRNSRTGSGR